MKYRRLASNGRAALSEMWRAYSRKQFLTCAACAPFDICIINLPHAALRPSAPLSPHHFSTADLDAGCATTRETAQAAGTQSAAREYAAAPAPPTKKARLAPPAHSALVRGARTCICMNSSKNIKVLTPSPSSQIISYICSIDRSTFGQKRVTSRGAHIFRN